MADPREANGSEPPEPAAHGTDELLSSVTWPTWNSLRGAADDNAKTDDTADVADAADEETGDAQVEEAESQVTSEPQPEVELTPEPPADAERETETESESSEDMAPEPEPMPTADAEAEPEPKVEPAADLVPEPEPVPEPAAAAEPVPEPAAAAEPELESEPAAGSEPDEHARNAVVAPELPMQATSEQVIEETATPQAIPVVVPAPDDLVPEPEPEPVASFDPQGAATPPTPATPPSPATPPDPASPPEPALGSPAGVFSDSTADTRVIEVFESEPVLRDPIAPPLAVEPESIAAVHAPSVPETAIPSTVPPPLETPIPSEMPSPAAPSSDDTISYAVDQVAAPSTDDTLVMQAAELDSARKSAADERLAETLVMPAARDEATRVAQAPIIRRADRDRADGSHPREDASQAAPHTEPPVRASVLSAGAPSVDPVRRERTTVATPPAPEIPTPEVPTPEVPRPQGPLPEVSELDVAERFVPPVAPKRKRRGLKVFLILFVIVLLLAAIYAVAVFLFRDTVPRGASIGGVDVGGMTTSEAVAALNKHYSARASNALPVRTADDKNGKIDPKAAGLSFDAAESVAQYQGFPYLPMQLWQHAVGVGDLPVVTDVDSAKLTKAVKGLAKSLSVNPVEGSIVLKDGKAEATKPVDGVVLDTSAAVATLQRGWLTDPTPIKLPTTTKAPNIDQVDVDAGLKLVNDTIKSGPVTIEVSGHKVELPVDAIVDSGTMVPVKGALQFKLDAKSVLKEVRSRLPEGVETASEDAHFEFKNGKPTIIAGKAGLGLNGDELAASVTKAAQSTSDRTVEASLTETSPTADVAALEKLGVKEKISEFSTHYSSNANRTQNLRIGASLITGVLVRPGETFSLSDTLGPRTVARGFRAANVVVGGVLQDDIGGGLSQLSTTVYNASHLGGMEDVEHTPHDNWFPRYPKGREATLWAGQIDNRFKNNTPYGVVVQAWLEESTMNLHVALWSTHYWDVKSVIGDPTGYTSAPTIHKTGAGCTPQVSEGPGFTVSYWRTLSLKGKVEHKQTWTWTYSPSPNIVCDVPKKEKD